MKDISDFVDEILSAKCNAEKVIAILRDYENLDDEVEDLNAKLDNELNTELLVVYRKLKMLNFLRMRLMERIENIGEENDAVAAGLTRMTSLLSHKNQQSPTLNP